MTLILRICRTGPGFPRYLAAACISPSLMHLLSFYFAVFHFCATVCKTVRPMLSDRCLSFLSVSVTLVYSRQMVGRIKMKLGMGIGLGPGHIVLDEDPAPLPKKGHRPPIFGPCLLRPNGWVDQDAIWYGGRARPRRYCVRWDTAPSKRGHITPTFRPIYCGQTAGWIKMPLGTEVELGPGHIVLDGDPAAPRKEHSSPPLFAPCLLWPNEVADLRYC